MPKAAPRRKSGGSRSEPYDGAVKGPTKGMTNIFRMNTDLGQHILKNPGIAQKIVEKADLKQSDVCAIDLTPVNATLTLAIRWFSRSVREQAT